MKEQLKELDGKEVIVHLYFGKIAGTLILLDNMFVVENKDGTTNVNFFFAEVIEIKENKITVNV